MTKWLEKCRLLLAILCAIGLPHHATAQFRAVLHTKTYVSPNGTYALTVTPSRQHGQGEATYRLSKQGNLVWEKQHPFSLWEAGVTDEGVSAGYAYSNGADGWSEIVGDRSYGSLVVARIDAEGTWQVLKTVERLEGDSHAPPEPIAQGIFVDQEGDRLVVRFRGSDDIRDRTDRWEVYGLSDGKERTSLVLIPTSMEGEGVWCRAMDAQPIAGTPLTLVIWSRTQEGHAGLQLTLVDRACHEVWQNTLPDEFNGLGKSFVPWQIRGLQLVNTAGLGPAKFEYRSVSQQAKITFAVAPAPDGTTWVVNEQGRVGDRVQTKTWEQPTQLPTVELKKTGTISLERPHTNTAFFSLIEFEIDSQGRLGFMSFSSDSRFYLFNPDGTQAAAVDLPAIDRQSRYSGAAFLGGNRWMVLRCPYTDGAKATAFLIDVAARTATVCDKYPGGGAKGQKGVAGSGNGGFAVLGDFREPGLSYFDDAGRLVWSAPSPGLAQTIAVRDGGEVGVLIGISPAIAVFGSDGAIKKTINLRETIPTGLNYVADLSADTDGGWILHDFRGSPPVYVLNADGKPLASFAPKYPDGRTFRITGGVQRARDGRLWTSDGHALLRLTDAGVVDFVVGRGPDDESLGYVCAFTIDPKGTMYAVDPRNATVHVFDAEGKRARVLKPDPKDFRVDHGIGSITIAGDGAVYYRTDSGSGGNDNGRYMKLDAGGARVGFQPAVEHEVAEEWFFRPGGQERLVLGYERAWLLDAQGTITKTIEHRADQKWLDKVSDAAVAADGSFVIVARSADGLASAVGPSITAYSADGTAIRTVELAPKFQSARAATNGKWACATSGAEVVLFHPGLDDARVFHLPGQTPEAWLQPFFSPDGTEVWLFDGNRYELARYALPVN